MLIDPKIQQTLISEITPLIQNISYHAKNETFNAEDLCQQIADAMITDYFNNKFCEEFFSKLVSNQLKNDYESDLYSLENLAVNAEDWLMENEDLMKKELYLITDNFKENPDSTIYDFLIETLNSFHTTVHPDLIPQLFPAFFLIVYHNQQKLARYYNLGESSSKPNTATFYTCLKKPFIIETDLVMAHKPLKNNLEKIKEAGWQNIFDSLFFENAFLTLQSFADALPRLTKTAILEIYSDILEHFFSIEQTNNVFLNLSFLNYTYLRTRQEISEENSAQPASFLVDLYCNNNRDTFFFRSEFELMGEVFNDFADNSSACTLLDHNCIALLHTLKTETITLCLDHDCSSSVTIPLIEIFSPAHIDHLVGLYMNTEFPNVATAIRSNSQKPFSGQTPLYITELPSYLSFSKVSPIKQTSINKSLQSEKRLENLIKDLNATASSFVHIMTLCKELKDKAPLLYNILDIPLVQNACNNNLTIDEDFMVDAHEHVLNALKNYLDDRSYEDDFFDEDYDELFIYYSGEVYEYFHNHPEKAAEYALLDYDELYEKIPQLLNDLHMNH